MLTLATQMIADSITTITPEEPATLELALMGIGTLATYAILTGWRPTRTSAAARRKFAADSVPMIGEGEREAARRAA